MANIKDGKNDFSALNSDNPYLGESWLEGLDMIRLMTKTDHQDRPSPDHLLKIIFFQSPEKKKEILIKANTILQSQDPKVKRTVKTYVNETIANIIIKGIQE